MGRRRKKVVKDKVWATNRRTTRRHFLFTPDELGMIEDLFWYCLAVCAAKHGIIVHAAVVMSTHIHLVYTDTRGVQPDFKRDLHRLFACGVKAIRGWPEEVFNQSKGGEHEPLGDKALIEDIGYLIANPPTAFAVRYAKDWPGAKTLPRDIGRRVIRVARPDAFFDSENEDWPDVAELELLMPDALEARYGGDEARRLIANDVQRRERLALAASKKHGIPFKGVRRVCRTPHTARARSYEVFGKVNPRFRASGDGELAADAIQEFRQFDAAYTDALERWTAGDRTAVFPHGTWWMRVHHGVPVQPPP